MQLLETIKCKNGKLYNLEFHQLRFDSARKANFPVSEKITLSELINIPNECQSGLYRCRVIYAEQIEKVEFLPHQHRKVDTLKIVHDDTIDYTFKYADRKNLNSLFEKRETADDILIAKDGCITDSFTANPIFFDGTKWWTSNTPLLAGTKREYLLSTGQIHECTIRINDLHKYKKVGLINALWDFENMPQVAIENVKF